MLAILASAYLGLSALILLFIIYSEITYAEGAREISRYIIAAAAVALFWPIIVPTMFVWERLSQEHD